tara:strand:- start:1358 stop:2053 length:696 start_codon:yes stop_codon:yes gene_type:complete
MKIKQGMILAAGLGKRMLPITLKTPKPLIKIGSQNLLERSIKLLINHGVEEIAINVHHLSNQIKDFIDNQRYKAKIIISDEKELLLNTGGGILAATKSFKNSFITINPDTLWNESYAGELQNLEDFYFKKNNPCLLLVDKNLSFDTSFKGDFNLNQDVISRDKNNKFIFTGLQILDKNIFSSIKEKVFSMNSIWDNLIKQKNLLGVESKIKFYHLNTKETYDKISNLKIID